MQVDIRRQDVLTSLFLASNTSFKHRSSFSRPLVRVMTTEGRHYLSSRGSLSELSRPALSDTRLSVENVDKASEPIYAKHKFHESAVANIGDVVDLKLMSSEQRTLKIAVLIPAYSPFY